MKKPGIERVQALADILRSALCCHSNETHAPIANPSNNAQLQGTAYHSPKLHSGPCSSMGMRPRTDRHRRVWPIYISRRLRLMRNVTTGSWENPQYKTGQQYRPFRNSSHSTCSQKLLLTLTQLFAKCGTPVTNCRCCYGWLFPPCPQRAPSAFQF